MRILSSFAVIAIVFAPACKKESQEVKVNEPSVSVNASLCWGNTWTTDEDFEASYPSIHLVYNDKVYVFNNYGQAPESTYISIYDGTSWQNILSDIPVGTNYGTDCFMIGNKGYFLKFTGQFYEYNFASNTWTQKANLPGVYRKFPALFAVANKGYVAGGYYFDADGDHNLVENWEYNPATNIWIQKANLPGFGRYSATGFSIGSKGYLVNGAMRFTNAIVYLNALLEYDPSANTWTTKSSFPGAARSFCESFIFSSSAYVGGGKITNNSPYTYFRDFYKYTPANNTWVKVADVPGSGFLENSFSLNSKGYVVVTDEDWENPTLQKYTPKYCPPVSSPVATGIVN